MSMPNQAQRSRRSLLLTALATGALSGIFAAACGDRTTNNEGCYPPGREWEVGPEGRPRGFCQWSLADNEGITEGFPTDGNIKSIGSYVYCFEPSEGQVCDACPAEDTDALVREQFEQECGGPIKYLKRGCVDTYTDDDGRETCCYSVVTAPVCQDARREAEAEAAAVD